MAMGNRKIGVVILRVLIGFFLTKDFLSFFYNKRYLFDKLGIVSYETYQDIVDYYKLQLLNIDFTKDWNINLFLALGFILSITFTLGIIPRISALILFFMLLVFKFRNIYLLDGGDNIVTVLLPLYVFIDSKSLIESYNTLKNRYHISKNYYIIKSSQLFVFAIMFQICIIYFFAGLHKLQGEVWRDGTALYYILNTDDFCPYSFLNTKLTALPFFVYGMTWFTVFFQLSFPFLVFIRKTRKTVLLLGILLHIGIFILMRIDNFSFLMIACYAIFFKDQEYDIARMKMQKLLSL